MNLDARELNDLAGFFGRRFPESSAPELARRAGVVLPASGGWLTLLSEAARQGRLPRLVAAAQKLCPGDPAVDALKDIVDGLARRPRIGVALGAAAALLLAVGVLALWPRAPAVDAVATTPEAPVETLAVAAAPEPALAQTLAVAAPEAPATRSSGLCPGEIGAVVGYYYAGHASPGTLGAVVTLAGGARVRSDYPDVHNRFDAAAPVTCVLPPGTRLRLDAAPLAVPGQAFWVPVLAGSIL